MSALSEITKAITPGGRVGDDTSLDRSPKKNWVESRGGLPKYVRMVAHAFLRKGMPMSRAISMAIGVIRNWAEGKGNVTPKVRAAAQATIAQWEAMKVSKALYEEDVISKLLVDAMFEEITKQLVCRHSISVMKSECPICQHSKESEKKNKKKVSKRFFSADERKSKDTCTYPGTTSFPVKDQSSFDDAWGLRGNSKIPKSKVESWLRGIAKKYGYSIPGELSKVEFEKILEEFDADASTPDDFFAQGEIEKSDDEKQLVFGWCSIAKLADGTQVVDKQGDVLEDIDQMEKVAYDFVLHSRDGGEMHVRKGVSTLVESFMSTPEKWEAMGIPDGTLPVGWWVGFKVNDAEVWKAVKDGKYKMFSVHGSGLRKALEDA